MKAHIVLGVLWALSMAPCLAQGPLAPPPVLSPEAKEILANLKLSLARLETATGVIDLTYNAPGGHNYDHRIRFLFKKPFKVAIDDLSGHNSLYYADWKATLYSPARRQAIELDLTRGLGELIQHFFALFQFSGFLDGVLLENVEEQFAIEVEKRAEGHLVRFRARSWGIYRLALSLDRIDVLLDRRTLYPRSLDVHEYDAKGLSRLLCRAKVLSLRVNDRVSDTAFVLKVEGEITRMESTQVLWMWIESLYEGARVRATDYYDSVKRRVTRYLRHPFDY